MLKSFTFIHDKELMKALIDLQVNDMSKEDFICIFNKEPEYVLGKEWRNWLELFLSSKYNDNLSFMSLP